MDYNIEVLETNREKFSSFLHSKVKEYNNEQSMHNKRARRKGAVQPINIIVSNHNEEWIGGITAEVYWGWMELNDFWFHEAHRGKGLGGQILEKAEKIAKEKGATKALVRTFEFQARTFYETKGYKVVGEIEDYPPGSSYYTLVKELG
ncbi:GNAT family N-acetyltransferase [Alkalibacillus haloalkaliphilus]|uniref:N-acetyltransferase n=1 Tax=Alkalibacillus haloalkaliphilus TaxID=94136 RepID=A0A511W2S9_9BACI|nr:GNAT family N-acetyltransferase [Alkalibacillus haloalkaliphilus]GEN45389.1 N-acetyltransferase [Alkalibacillus haloalkaliphilus]